MRDRAILSVGLQVGLRPAEIAALTVGDLHQNRGYDSLRVSRKGGRRDALAINPADRGAITRLSRSRGHGADNDGPLFRPLKHNGKCRDERRHMEPDAIDRVVRKYAGTFDAFEACHLTAAPENTGAARRRAESRRVPRSEHSKAL